MLDLYVSISGPEVARKLAEDEEEFAYAMQCLANDHSVDPLAEAVVDYMSDGECEIIRQWLVNLAAKIEVASNGG